MERRLQVGIVGGGISGLAAAYSLNQEAAKRGVDLDLVLLERSSRMGGVIKSHVRGDLLLEEGPECFAAFKPAAVQLAKELGLSDQLIPSHPRQKTYVLHAGRLRPLASGMAFLSPVRLREFWETAPLSRRGRVRALMEPFVPRSEGDLTVRQFLDRRLGREFTEKLGEPLVSAIYAGDAGRMSAASTLPELHRIEQKCGSLWRGMRRRKGPVSGGSGPLFMTLRDGMESFVDRLVNAIGSVETILGTGDLRVARRKETWRVQTANGDDFAFDSLILSTPARASADLLAGVCPELSEGLRDITYASTRIVYLAYPRKGFSHPLDGYGFIVPATEGTTLDACTWVSSKFEGRCPSDRVLIRCAIHGGRKSRPELSDEATVETAHGELKAALGISCPPDFSEVFHVRKAMPQLLLGHQARIEKIERSLKAQPGLFLLGPYRLGIGIPDCIGAARGLAAEIADQADQRRVA